MPELLAMLVTELHEDFKVLMRDVPKTRYRCLGQKTVSCLFYVILFIDIYYCTSRINGSMFFFISE